jgi:hypothetical protein
MNSQKLGFRKLHLKILKITNFTKKILIFKCTGESREFVCQEFVVGSLRSGGVGSGVGGRDWEMGSLMSGVGGGESEVGSLRSGVVGRESQLGSLRSEA